MTNRKDKGWFRLSGRSFIKKMQANVKVILMIWPASFFGFDFGRLICVINYTYWYFSKPDCRNYYLQLHVASIGIWRIFWSKYFKSCSRGLFFGDCYNQHRTLQSGNLSFFQNISPSLPDSLSLHSESSPIYSPLFRASIFVRGTYFKFVNFCKLLRYGKRYALHTLQLIQKKNRMK